MTRNLIVLAVRSTTLIAMFFVASASASASYSQDCPPPSGGPQCGLACGNATYTDACGTSVGPCDWISFCFLDECETFTTSSDCSQSGICCT